MFFVRIHYADLTAMHPDFRSKHFTCEVCGAPGKTMVIMKPYDGRPEIRVRRCAQHIWRDGV